MSHITIPYESDGVIKWAVWSTIVEDIIVYDATATELIEYKAEKAAKEARREEARKILKLKNNDYEYDRQRTESLAQKVRDKNRTLQ